MNQRVVLLGVASTIVIAAAAEDTGGTLALLDYELAPGFSGLPPHRHSQEDAAIYVLEGRLLVRVGGLEQTLGPGDFAWLPRAILHALYNPGPEPARFLLVLLPAGLEQGYRDLETTLRDAASPSPAALAPVLHRYGVQLGVGSETDPQSLYNPHEHPTG